MEDLERRNAEELAKHAFATVELEARPGQDFYFVCECGHREVKDGRTSKRDWLAAHQAAELAPMIAEAKARALREAADDLYPDAGARLTHASLAIWLRTRADWLVAK